MAFLYNNQSSAKILNFKLNTIQVFLLKLNFLSIVSRVNWLYNKFIKGHLNWENGNSTSDISLLAPLARALNTSLDELLFFQSQLSEVEVTNTEQESIEVFLYEGYDAGEAKCK